LSLLFEDRVFLQRGKMVRGKVDKKITERFLKLSGTQPRLGAGSRLFPGGRGKWTVQQKLLKRRGLSTLTIVGVPAREFWERTKTALSSLSYGDG